MISRIAISYQLTNLFLLFFTVSGFAQTQPVLIEKVERKGNEVVIPYEKYKYPNGLTLIVHEDHSDPIVHVDVTYHVGSAREEIGKSGFAHFFEHMMFQGSDHVQDEEHFKMVTEAGGTMNGSTNMDRTNYFQTVPRNQLERVLWLEADRMGFLLDAVTQQKFEVQRSTVKNERGQRYDNRPYGLVQEKTIQALYPYGHPYSWPTIGYLQDLDRVNVNDLKKFFLRWYGPNNAVITVAGDVQPGTVTSLVGKYFGNIPAGPAVDKMKPQVPVLKENRYISYGDQIRFPYLQLSWPGVQAGHPDEAALEALSYLLSDSKSSPLQQAFVKSGKAMSANSFFYGQELSGTFGINATMVPGNSLASAEDTIRKILRDFAAQSVNKSDLQKLIVAQEVNSYRWFESVSRKASLLAYNETYFGNPDRIGQDLRRYQALKPEDVKRVLSQYLLDKPAVILSVYPRGEESLVARTDNFTPRLPDPTGSDPNLYGDLKYVKAKDSFNRAEKPSSGENPAPRVPEFWKHSFKGTARAIGTRLDESPTVSAVLYFPAGHIFENPDQSGLAALTANLLNEGTKFSTAEAVESRLESLGSVVRFSADDQWITANIYSLRKNLDSTLAIAREMLNSPRFATEDFEREKKKALEAISNRTTQPGVIADMVFDRIIHAEKDIRSIPVSGTTESVESITLDDVKRYHAGMLSAAPPDLVIAGDITREEAVDKFAFLDKFTAKKPLIPTFAEGNPNPGKYYFVHREKAAQSEIRVGYLSMPYDATGEFFTATFMNYPLGGSFNSRINLNLREDKGYTYGARGYFNGSAFPGPYKVSTSVRTDATDSALVEILNELHSYSSEGASAVELQFARSSIGQAEALQYETPWQKAGFLNRLQQYDLDPSYPERQQAIMNELSEGRIREIASKYLPMDKMVVVVVGDRKQVLDRLKSRGYDFQEVDSEGRPL